VWKTEAAYWGWLRGALRRLWADYPLRKEWKSRQLRPVTNEEKEQKLFHPSTKNVGQCYYCNQWFAGSKLECDHKISSEGCTSKETAEAFLWYCGGGIGEEWVLSCKPCHKAKTHGERNGMTLEEAIIDKQAIAILNSKKDRVWLNERGVVPASNAKKRREQIKQFLSKENRMEKITEEALKDYVSEVGEFEKEHRKYSSFFCWVSHTITAQDIVDLRDEGVDASDFLNVLVTMNGTWDDSWGTEWDEITYEKVEEYEEVVPEQVIPAHTITKYKQTPFKPNWVM